MIKEYSSNFIKIFFWQFVAFLLRFLSLFIVTPYLSEIPQIYGIYTICISITIFLNYADLGFIRSAQKYATESFAQNNRTDEMKYIGFGTFVLLIVSLIIAIIFYYISLHPQMLITNIKSSEHIHIASQLLKILAIFTPVMTFKRTISQLFNIRLEGYKYQRLSLLASTLTILTVPYFFRDGHYEIVKYFLFSQVVSAITIIISFFIARKNYSYDIPKLFTFIRFDISIYNKVKGLAFSGLYLMIAWILFFEMDQIAIGKFIGVDKVSIYAIAASCSAFIRTLLSIFFDPFTIRANHFAGSGDDKGLKEYCIELSVLTAPIVILPIVAFAKITEPFTLCWVGLNFIESIEIIQFIIFIWIFSFISYPISAFLVAKEKIKQMYIIATLQPIIYWLGVLLTYSHIGLLSIPLFKFVAITIATIYYTYFLIENWDISLYSYFRRALLPLLIPVLSIQIALTYIAPILPREKSPVNLAIVIVTYMVVVMISLLISCMLSRELRSKVNSIVNNSRSFKKSQQKT